MKNTFSLKDAKELRSAILDQIALFTNNGNSNILLLSGGIDSCVVLFSLMELNKPFKTVNFSFANRHSYDETSVRKLQEKADFKASYITIDGLDMETLKSAIQACKSVFGRVRAVKVETMYAMMKVKQQLPKSGVNILTGFGGDDVGGYSRKQQIEIAKLGEENEIVISRRKIKKSQDEFRAVFSGYPYFSPYTDENVQSVILKYTTKAWNYKSPKAALVYAFNDYFSKYKSARKPIGLHKGGGENDMFEQIAKDHGYSSALQMFNRIGKENER